MVRPVAPAGWEQQYAAVGEDVEQDIPPLSANSRGLATLAARQRGGGGEDTVSKALQRDRDSSMRNCKIITFLWAVLTALVIMIAQIKPDVRPGSPLHWSSMVLGVTNMSLQVIEDASQQRDMRGIICNVRDHGAVGDGRTMDTMAISSAIKHCQGRGVVLLPAPGTYAADYVQLRSHSTLRIEAGAELLAGQEPNPPQSAVAYPFAPLIRIGNATDVVVEGRGAIRGQGLQWSTREPGMEDYWAERIQGHPLLEVSGSERVLIRDITVQDSLSVALGVRKSRLVVAERLKLHNFITDEKHQGILVENSDTVEIAHCEIWSAGTFGFGIRASGGHRVHDIVLQSCVLRNGSGVGVMPTPENEAAGIVSEVVFRDLLLDGRNTPTWNRTEFPSTGGGLMVRAGQYSLSAGGAVTPGQEHLAVERVLFQDVVGFNMTRGIELAIQDTGQAVRTAATKGQLASMLTTRVSGVEFQNITFDGLWERAVRVNLPPGSQLHRLSMQDLEFKHSSKYGWDCTPGGLFGRVTNVKPDIPLECAVKAEPLEAEEAFAD